MFRSSFSVVLAVVVVVGVSAFVPKPQAQSQSQAQAQAQSQQHSTTITSNTGLFAIAPSDEGFSGLFKAGLGSEVGVPEQAAKLAKQKIKTVQNLGWKTPQAKRRGNARPRHWAFGGAGEKPVQDKPNYDPASEMCVETWLSLPDFYTIVKDDSAVADTIFVALAGAGAFIERDVATEVLEQWWPQKGKFDEAAFAKTVKQGRQGFLAGWAGFGGLTSFAVLGIVAPTNPLQLALVSLLETAFHNDAKLAALASGSLMM